MTGLRHESIRLAKKYNRLRKHESLILNDSPGKDTVDDAIQLLDTIASTNDTLVEAVGGLFIQEALSLLTTQQQRVIKATILEGATEQQAASELGVTKQAVNHIKKRALKKLKKHFVSNEPFDNKILS